MPVVLGIYIRWINEAIVHDVSGGLVINEDYIKRWEINEKSKWVDK
jgi:hypothetical protein